MIANVAKGYALAKNVKRENPAHAVVIVAVVKKSVVAVNNQLKFFVYSVSNVVMIKNSIYKLFLPVVLLVFINAQTIELNNKKVTILKDEVVIEIRGLVCSFCAVGLQGGLSSLNNVDKEKYINGVLVDIEHHFAVIAEISGKDINIDEALTMITKSGYEVFTVYTNRSGEKIDVRNFEVNKN